MVFGCRFGCLLDLSGFFGFRLGLFWAGLGSRWVCFFDFYFARNLGLSSFGRLGAVPVSGVVREEPARYGSAEVKVRLGQGAFRVLVTDAYSRRCAVTGESTLPVLEAAHIRPFAEDGPHAIENGLLLRSDMHILFDSELLTVTPEHRLEVSSLIKDQYSNGKLYYSYHGQELRSLPTSLVSAP